MTTITHRKLNRGRLLCQGVDHHSGTHTSIGCRLHCIAWEHGSPTHHSLGGHHPGLQPLSLLGMGVLVQLGKKIEFLMTMNSIMARLVFGPTFIFNIFNITLFNRPQKLPHTN